MLKLIIKDLTFNKLQVILGILIVILSTLFILAGRQYIIIPFIMAPSLLFNQIVGKGCYLDDKNSAYVFLRALPIPKNMIVLSKYAESILVLFLSYAIIFGSNLVLMFFDQPLYHLDALLIMVVSILLLYFAVFLWLFFKYDYASAQQAGFVLIISWIGTLKLQQYLSNSGVIITRILHVDFLYLLLLIAIGVFIGSCKLSINAFAIKE
jgi:hypothetical protein